MNLVIVCVVAAGLLVFCGAELTAQPAQPAVGGGAQTALQAAGGGAQMASQAAKPAASPLPAAPQPAAPLRFFFVADVHSRHAHLERFLEDVERERPVLVLEGGDFVHDGTAAEFRRAAAYRASLDIPWYGVLGNHDVVLRGPFAVPPAEIPEVQSFSHGAVRFILLDNHDEELSESQFQWLEAELEAHAGQSIVVAMHVPALVSREPAAVRLRRLAPFRLASPVMQDSAQVRRFTTLMERHGVALVLAGHTHYPDRVTRGGVEYITAGAAGGLTPGLGIANEYLDVLLDGREVRVRRVEIGRPAHDPVSLVARVFRFYADLNGFNHAVQGWNYVPSASVQFRGAVSRTEFDGGETVMVSGTASFERLLGVRGRHGFISDVGLSAGSRALTTHLGAGYKLRPVGDYNRNLYVAGVATTNAGILHASPAAGVGAQLGVGFEWLGVTGELSWHRATNLSATAVSIGHRF
jgi:predicted phosphodiesterase